MNLSATKECMLYARLQFKKANTPHSSKADILEEVIKGYENRGVRAEVITKAKKQLESLKKPKGAK